MNPLITDLHRQILNAVRENDRITQVEMAELFGINPTSVARNTSRLKAMKILKIKRDGIRVIYRVNEARLLELSDKGRSYPWRG